MKGRIKVKDGTDRGTKWDKRRPEGRLANKKARRLDAWWGA